MTTDDTFANWLRANPAPDLQALVERHGGYDKITPEAWAEYDRALAEWQERRRHRPPAAQAAPIVADPRALCICGLPGVVGRKRRVGGREIWRRAADRELRPGAARGG